MNHKQNDQCYEQGQKLKEDDIEHAFRKAIVKMRQNKLINQFDQFRFLFLEGFEVGLLTAQGIYKS